MESVLERSAAVLVLGKTVENRPIFDHKRLDVYFLSIDYSCRPAVQIGRYPRRNMNSRFVQTPRATIDIQFYPEIEYGLGAFS